MLGTENIAHIARFINALKDKCQIKKRLIGLSKIGVAEAVLQKENQGNPSDNKLTIIPSQMEV